MARILHAEMIFAKLDKSEIMVPLCKNEDAMFRQIGTEQ